MNFLTPIFVQFAQLEDDFSDLLKGSSIETQKAFNGELADQQRQSSHASLASGDDDSNLIPEDYESDEEKSAEWKENENDEDAHVTKVVTFFTFLEQ